MNQKEIRVGIVGAKRQDKLGEGVVRAGDRLWSLFDAELTLAQARNEYQSPVQLYKALGGGCE